MISTITSAPHTQPPTQASAAIQKPAQAKSQAAPTDTVRLSTVVLPQTAAQEANETQVQTAKEANSGDLQARALLAKEAAAHARRK